jgi:Tol biopolymer transport system component
VCLEQQTSGTAASMTRVSVETGEKRPLVLPIANTRGDGALAVSPDGHRLAFTRGWGAFERDIYEVAISAEMVPNGQVRRLTFDKTEVDGIAWTADGRRLVFSSKRGGRYELWEVPLGSATPVKLAAAGDDPHNPAIPARGDHLVYSHQNLDWNIWRAQVGSRAEGKATQFISSTRLELHSVYSPDGHHIAFESNRSGDMAIWTCNADGTNAVQLTTFGKHWAGSPQWSPDGRFIAFDGDAAGNWDVYVINANGGKPIRMTGDAGEEFRPSWSRDGKGIYYCSSRNNHSEVRKVPSTGGAEVQVTKNGGAIAFESADGKDLYYTTDLPGLWKMPVAGGREIKVLNSLEGANFVPTEHGLYFIEDQPLAENRFRLKLLDPASGSMKTMAVLPGPVGDEMSISPDEKWMLFLRPDREASELMLIENFR